MKYLHTMLRVGELERSLRFYTEGLGFRVLSREDYAEDRFSLVFLESPDDSGRGAQIELTHNWDTSSYTKGDGYGHLAYAVSSIDQIQERLKKAGYDLSWGPGLTPSGKTKMAFVDDPDGYEIELLEYR